MGCRSSDRFFWNVYIYGFIQFGLIKLEHLQCPAAFEQWIGPLENSPWIIRCPEVWDRREAGHDPEDTRKVVRYLANYANRIALSDARILAIEGEQVLFSYKDYRDHDQQKEIWIDGVELIHRFLQHLLPPRMHHIRRYGWMSRRSKNEKLDYLRQYHGTAEPEPEEKEAEGDGPPCEEHEHTQACRFCSGQMHLTGRTFRPTVPELMQMPLAWFRRAQAGARIVLGEKLSRIEVQPSDNESLTAARQARAEEIKRQYDALLTAGFL